VFAVLFDPLAVFLPQGVNCSCFAYGHTGSGKTYSMFGCGGDAVLQEDDQALEAPPEGSAFGLVPRVCFHLLRRLHETNTGAKKCWVWSVRC
ncbi:unnamed protein product, partial [Scytosiphon promiscuus]